MQENTKGCFSRVKEISSLSLQMRFFFSSAWNDCFGVFLPGFFFLFEFCSFLYNVEAARRLDVFLLSLPSLLIPSCSWHLQSVPGTVSIPVSGRLSSGLQEYVQLPVWRFTWTSSRGSAGETTSVPFFFMYNFFLSRTSLPGASLSFYFEVELLHLCLFCETDQKAN